MRIIDCHTHPCFGNEILQKISHESGARFDIDGFQSEMSVAGITNAVAIGVDLQSNKVISELGAKHENIIPILGINLERRDNLSFYRQFVPKALKEKRFLGIKIFLGYDHFSASSNILEPFYTAAEKYEVPVIFHTGDTFKPMRKFEFLKYSHPFGIDEVAVKHKNVNFLIAHSGNPWTEDVAEIIYKNENCYADISGWFLNDTDEYYENFMAEKFKGMMEFAGQEKIMFGTDWPLIKIKPYVEFLKKNVNGAAFDKIAYENAKRFWKL